MENLIDTIKNAIKIPDLRRKLLFTVGMLLIFRIGTYIPVPGMSREALTSLSGSNSLFGLIDIITGGAFSQATIFAMSITPYINSSIIMQLLCVAIPALERMQKEGEEGRKKIQQYVRYGTVVLGFLQALGLYISLNNSGSIIHDNTIAGSIFSFLIVTLSFTAGTAFLMWLGEQITEYGIGNGISLIIFAGIISRVPTGINYLVMNTTGDAGSILRSILIVVLVALVIVGVLWVQLAERRIPIQYTKRVVGRKVYGGQSSYLPIKVNLAGVIPIIFAMSITMFPSVILSFAAPNPANDNWFVAILRNISSVNSAPYLIVYALLIVGFTFFYTFIQFNPIEIANNMKKNGGLIPGIRTGKPTSDYIYKTLIRITLFGAVFLAVIAIFPYAAAILSGAQSNMFFGGTAALILVGVALDTVKQIESQMLMRHYKGFLE